MPKPPSPAPPRPLHQLALFPEAAELRHVVPAANCWRFYRLSLQDDLFGGTALLRQWGRIGTQGQSRLDLHADRGQAQAQAVLATLLRQKVKRGYRSTETT